MRSHRRTLGTRGTFVRAAMHHHHHRLIHLVQREVTDPLGSFEHVQHLRVVVTLNASERRDPPDGDPRCLAGHEETEESVNATSIATPSPMSVFDASILEFLDDGLVARTLEQVTKIEHLLDVDVLMPRLLEEEGGLTQ